MLKISKICHLIFRLLFLLEGGVWSLRNLTISVPRAVLSGTEASAVLRCDYELEGAALYSLRWYRADTEFYRYVPREHPPAMVFPLTGTTVDLTQSDSNQVVLVGLNRQLSGVYQCEVSADAPLFHTDIRSAPLSIVDPPFMAPKLRVHRESYSRGSTTTANCSVDAAYPPPNITWTINDVPLAVWVSPPPPPLDFSERGVASLLQLTFTDDVSAEPAPRHLVTHQPPPPEHHASVYYGGDQRTLPQRGSALQVWVPLGRLRGQPAALRCAADILGVYSRRSEPAWLRQDAPAHASVTTDHNHGSSLSCSPGGGAGVLTLLCVSVMLRAL